MFDYLNWLVVSIPEKYESQLGLFFPYIMESHKIPWFQTTNQLSNVLLNITCRWNV